MLISTTEHEAGALILILILLTRGRAASNVYEGTFSPAAQASMSSTGIAIQRLL